MNYLFFYYNEIPTYVKLCLNNILNLDKNANIFLATDQKIENKNIKVLNILQTDLIEKFELIKDNFKVFNYDSHNPLWASSLLRIFALKSLKDYFRLDSFVHFDTDVLIYKSFNDIQDYYKFPGKKISITQRDSKNLVFGYSYFPNSESIDWLVNKLDKNLLNVKNLQNIYTRGIEIPEMRHLGILYEFYPEMFNLLPILPYENSQIIFDPASYGQYLNGTHLKRGNYIFKRRWVSMNHIVGSELKSKRINCGFKQQPFVLFEKSKVDLVNLHVHSKNLAKFLPKNQKNYFNL